MRRRIDHRDGEKLSQRHERVKRLLVRSRILDQDKRASRLGEQRCHVFNFHECRLRRGRGWNRADVLRLRPFVDHRFHRHAEIGRSLGRTLSDFAGAHDALVERVDGAGLKRHFDDRLDQPLRAADHVQIAIPLRSGIEFALAVADRIPRTSRAWELPWPARRKWPCCLAEGPRRRAAARPACGRSLACIPSPWTLRRLVTAIQIGGAGCPA